MVARIYQDVTFDAIQKLLQKTEKTYLLYTEYEIDDRRMRVIFSGDILFAFSPDAFQFPEDPFKGKSGRYWSIKPIIKRALAKLSAKDESTGLPMMDDGRWFPLEVPHLRMASASVIAAQMQTAQLLREFKEDWFRSAKKVPIPGIRRVRGVWVWLPNMFHFDIALQILNELQMSSLSIRWTTFALEARYIAVGNPDAFVTFGLMLVELKIEV